MDFSSSGSLETRSLNGPTGQLVDAGLGREQVSGEAIAWYLPDRLGTVRDLINNSGDVIGHIDYSAFGTVLGEIRFDRSDDGLRRHGARYRDGPLNLAVYRVQDPATGRWTSEVRWGLRRATWICTATYRK